MTFNPRAGKLWYMMPQHTTHGRKEGREGGVNSWHVIETQINFQRMVQREKSLSPKVIYSRIPFLGILEMMKLWKQRRLMVVRVRDRNMGH